MKKKKDIKIFKYSKKTDIAYIAGFWEGEGSAGIYHHGEGKYRLNVCITNTNKPVLEWIKNKVGHGWIFKRRQSNANWKIRYDWLLGDYKAYYFLKSIQPFLKFRKKEVDALINNQLSIHFPRGEKND
jgi:intein/homing endonuclease